MKNKTKVLSFEEVMKLKRPVRKTPCRPSAALHRLVRLLTAADLKDANFHYETDISRAGDGPFLILMNHSSFIDLEMVFAMFDKPFCIVTTSDSFVGKYELLRHLGCIPTNKFATDPALVMDIRHTLRENRTSVLMYPEASYSFDGTATPLPRGMGKLLKMLRVPVLMVKTEGAFLRDPLYNMLQKRKTDVSAKVTCLFTRDEIRELTDLELEDRLDEAFSFDNFRVQQEKGIRITEDFRADGLNRILYKCPHCLTEGKNEGKGTKMKCDSCGVTYELTEDGFLRCENGEGKFIHIPDWYRWEREEVRRELEDGSYRMELDGEICMLVDYKAVYKIGRGHLSHSTDGFVLTGADGKLDFRRKPLNNYSIYSDYYWYEMGDVICIGTTEEQYYVFPDEKDVVAKARLAAEELFKLKKAETAVQRDAGC